jgi:hypothetical protein
MVPEHVQCPRIGRGDACVAERAVSGPQHGRRMDGIGTRDIRLRLATGKPPERFLALVDS